LPDAPVESGEQPLDLRQGLLVIPLFTQLEQNEQIIQLTLCEIVILEDLL